MGGGIIAILSNAKSDLTKVFTKLDELRKVANPVITGDKVAAQVKTPVVSNPEQTKSKFAGGAMKIVQAALPIASAIPGPIGAVAGVLKHALNDDEWFEEYGVAGATFNELLTLSEDEQNITGVGGGNVDVLHMRASYASILTGVVFTNAIKNEIMPSVLAFVRSKTNNVLNETPESYAKCLEAIVKLYAIYYTLRKYEKLALNIPLNIPSLPDVANGLNPQTYNQLVGIGDALEAYLKTTTGVPYALAAYIRWRFGTAFHSENTGKPGIICYDYANTTVSGNHVYLANLQELIKWAYYGKENPMTDANAIDIIGTLVAEVDAQKNIIHSTGRCAADFALAYANNGVQFTVDDAHYDAKEFNLRCNYTMGSYGDGKLVLDSRLVASPSLQAVTISTQIRDSSVSDLDKMILFPVLDTVMYLYDPKDAFAYYCGGSSASIPFRYKKWYFTDVSTVATSRMLPSISGFPNWTASTTIAATVSLPSGGLGLFQTILRFASLVSLQFHNKAMIMEAQDDGEGYQTRFEFTSLSYDTAYISDSQLESIQRIALRNLFRGNYARRIEVSHMNEKIKEATEDFVADVLPDKVNIKA